MRVSQVLLHASLHYATITQAIPSPRHVQSDLLVPCAFRSPEPCQCPENTVFQNTTTEVIIGANAKDVAEILYRFFDVPWIGVDPVNTTGEDLAVGSTRTMPQDGLYFVEELLESWKTENSSFSFVVAQKNVPVVLENDKGTYYFSGYWDNTRAYYLNPTQTQILWHAHGCLTLPAGFDIFQQDGINDTFTYLKERGQLVGNSTSLHTVVYPPDFAGGLVIPS